MAKNEVPAWAGSIDTMSRRVAPIIHLIGFSQSVTPAEIDKIVRPEGSTKDYSAKYITFLRLLGFEFSMQKDGRKIISYTCTAEPDNVEAIRSIGPKVKASKKKEVNKTSVKTKSLDTIKAKNLAKLKSVSESKSRAAKKVRDGNTDEAKKVTSGSSYSVDTDWDSTDGLDLKTLV